MRLWGSPTFLEMIYKLGRRIPVLGRVLHPLLQKMGGGGNVLEQPYAVE